MKHEAKRTKNEALTVREVTTQRTVTHATMDQQQHRRDVRQANHQNSSSRCHSEQLSHLLQQRATVSTSQRCVHTEAANTKHRYNRLPSKCQFCLPPCKNYSNTRQKAMRHKRGKENCRENGGAITHSWGSSEESSGRRRHGTWLWRWRQAETGDAGSRGSEAREQRPGQLSSWTGHVTAEDKQAPCPSGS